MKPLRFNRLSKNVGLVLISSSLILGGCARHPECDPPPEGQPVPEQARPDCRGGAGGHGGHGGHIQPGSRTVIVTHGVGGVGGATSRATSAGSSRGGFGATGHATADGS